MRVTSINTNHDVGECVMIPVGLANKVDMTHDDMLVFHKGNVGGVFKRDGTVCVTVDCSVELIIAAYKCV